MQNYVEGEKDIAAEHGTLDRHTGTDITWQRSNSPGTRANYY
jgi:hypothetical protein